MTRSPAHDRAAIRGWLGTTPPAFQQALLDRCTEAHIPAGSGFRYDGPPPDGLYGIVAGAIDIVLAVPGTAGHLLHVARPGYWFGQHSLAKLDGADQAPRPLSFLAREEAVLYRLAPQAIDDLVASATDNWRQFAALIREHAALAVSHVAVLLIDQPPRRVAYQLLRLLGDGRQETLAIVQSDLAATVGLSRNSVNRVLRELADAGVIRIGYGRVEIIDAAELEAFCWADAVPSASAASSARLRSMPQR